MDPLAIYDQVTKIGAPILFSYGLWRGWWYLKPHVEMLLARIAEMTADLNEARAQTARATDLAEQSHAIAVDSLAESKATRAIIEVNRQSLVRIEAVLGVPPLVKEGGS